jgi:hypothetical protein
MVEQIPQPSVYLLSSKCRPPFLNLGTTTLFNQPKSGRDPRTPRRPTHGGLAPRYPLADLPTIGEHTQATTIGEATKNDQT